MTELFEDEKVVEPIDDVEIFEGDEDFAEEYDMDPGKIKLLAKKISDKCGEYKRKAIDYLKGDDLEDFLLRVDEKFTAIPKVGTHLAWIPKFALLVRSYAMKEYREISLAGIVAIMTSLVYFAAKIDVIPDILPGLGFIDDAIVIASVLQWCEEDLSKYMDWLQEKRESQGK